MTKYPVLLSPVMAGNAVLKNRMAYPNASPHTLQGPETFPAEGFREYHKNLARNGAAIVTVAEWTNPNQRKGPASADFTHMQSFDMKDPSVHNYQSLMAQQIHFYGSKLLICANVDWPEGYSLLGGPLLFPGQDKSGPDLRPIPKEMIPEVIQKYVDKLRLYKDLGYDGMTLRCDELILPSPFGCDRDDEYGGNSVENRSRFVRELYAAIHKAFGENFIREAVIAWEQPWGYGFFLGKGVDSDYVSEFCHLIDKDVHIFQVREHDGLRAHPTGFNFVKGDHPAAVFCKRLKEEGIHALLEPIGGFQEPEEMEELVANGICDLIGAARAFIADPEYGIKLREGRGEDIIPCLKCNKCHGTIIPGKPDPWITMCSVNPRHGLQHELDRMVLTTHSQKVAVIGGGCTGMRAAVEAAMRGHEVTLYEKSGVLGGQLLHADYFDFKWPIREYKDWLIHQLDKNHVTVLLNTEPTAAEIAQEGYDDVIAATGAVPSFPRSIEGLMDENGNPRYLHCWQIWGKEAELGHHVVIVGGSETGIETAIYLLRAGHAVTVLTRQSEIAHDASRLHYITATFIKEDGPDRAHNAAEWERYDDFTGIVNAATQKVDGNTVTWTDEKGELHETIGDTILICGGSRKLTAEALSYAVPGIHFRAAGDCVDAGNIQRCNFQAFAAASEL